MQRYLPGGRLLTLCNGLTILLLMADQHVTYQSIPEALCPSPLINRHGFLYPVMKTLVLQAAQLLNMPLPFLLSKRCYWKNVKGTLLAKYTAKFKVLVFNTEDI